MEKSCLNFSNALSKLIQDAIALAKKAECEAMLAKFGEVKESPLQNLPTPPIVGLKVEFPEMVVGPAIVVMDPPQETKVEEPKPAGKRKEKKAPAEVKPVEVVEEKAEEITAADVKKACSALAAKLHDKQRVIDIVKSFNVSKVDDLPAEKRPALLAALTAAAETTSQKSESPDGY